MKYQNTKIIQIFSAEKGKFVDDCTFYNIHKNWTKVPQETRTEIATKMKTLRELGFKVRLVGRRLTNEC
jgi:hypothetical protein